MNKGEEMVSSMVGDVIPKKEMVREFWLEGLHCVFNSEIFKNQ